MEFITLDANADKVARMRAARAARNAMSYEERTAKRKEIASTADGLVRIEQMDRESIDVAIHLDSWVTDMAVVSNATSAEALYYRSHYDPVVGVFGGTTFGGPASSLYARNEYYAILQPTTLEVESITVPTLSSTLLDPTKLRIRESATKRQQEAMILLGERMTFATACGQGSQTPIATAITNYVSGGAPYSGKTVYIADPNVQAGTYETTNIISLPGEGGLTPLVGENIVAQMELMGRTARTIHIPKAGQPWRKLLRSATLVNLAPSNGTTGGLTAPNSPNAGLRAIAPSMLDDVMNKGMQDGLVLSWFGMTLKFKSNNALPQGYGFITTDKPCVQVFNITDGSVSVDHTVDPTRPYFTNHYEKRTWTLGRPDPWLRNFAVVNFGATTGL